MLRAPLRNSLLPIKYSDSVMAIGLFQLVSNGHSVLMCGYEINQ